MESLKVVIADDNKKMVDEPIDSWGVLWDEKYKDSILMQDSVRDAFGVALKYLGYSLNSTDLDELQAAKNLLVGEQDGNADYHAGKGK